MAVPLAACAHGGADLRAAACAPVAMASAADTAIQIDTLQLDAGAFSPEPLRVRVYLPPGYRATADRYPVLHINDGQDMEAVQLEQTLARLHADGAIGAAIVVAVDMPADRMGAYGLSDRANARSVTAQTRYGRVGSRAHDYSHWVATVLVPAIDARYRTRPTPDARTVLGWSLGALNAFNLGWQYPELFGRVGAFSPSLWLSSQRDTADAVQRTRLAQGMVARSSIRNGLKLFFAVGTQEETDDRDGDGIHDAMDDTRDLIEGWHDGGILQTSGLRQLGYSVNLDHASRPDHADAVLFTLEGGEHNQASWARMLPAFLEWAYAPRASERVANGSAPGGCDPR